MKKLLLCAGVFAAASPVFVAQALAAGPALDAGRITQDIKTPFASI